MKINNITIEFKAINNVPVFTFKDTDKIFRWSSGTANRLFNKIKNFKNYLTESKDYYYISKAELIEQNPELKEFVGQKQYIRLYVVTTSTIGLMIELLNDKEYSRALSNFKKIVTNSNLCICELGKGDNNYQRNYYNRSNNPQATAPKIIEEETNRMKEGIYDSFYNHSKLYRASPSYLLLLNTGIRLGELLALTWDNINLDDKIMKITATQETISGENKIKKLLRFPKLKVHTGQLH